MTEIVFIGTGGGRINLLKQFRGTGGFRINSESANIHVDPGPGALTNSIRLKQNLLKLDVLIVTHSHIDHYNDAGVIVEAISRYALKKRGILIASKEALEGNRLGDKAVSSYHQSRIEQVHVVKYGERKKFKTQKGEFEIEIIKTKHDAPDAFGFKLFINGSVIGYTGDTEYFDVLGEKFRGCSCLIVNCLKPAADRFAGHMSSSDVVRLLKKAKPKLAVITHMGMNVLRAGPKKEAEMISGKSGVHTVAAYDGMKISIAAKE